MKKSNLIFKGLVVILSVTLFVSCTKELDQSHNAPQITPKESLQRNPALFFPFPDTLGGKPVTPRI